jgi:mono/diheme cytochrome c family protein
MRRVIMAFLFWAILPAAVSPVAAQAPGKKTILDGVYTAAQATRGKDSFVTQCSSCHSEDLSGKSAPALKGSQFIDNWREYSLDTLYTYINENMPRGKGKLTEDAYVDILSYVLQVNEYAAGGNELTRDAISAVGFVGKNGPAQVPDSALIQIVGCLTQRDDGIWLLTKSTDPIRIRNEEKPTPEELKSSGARSLGSQTFRLVYPDFEPGFDVGSHKGRKMHAKGYFLINPVDQRLSVKWMGPVGEGCDQ